MVNFKRNPIFGQKSDFEDALALTYWIQLPHLCYHLNLQQLPQNSKGHSKNNDEKI